MSRKRKPTYRERKLLQEIKELELKLEELRDAVNFARFYGKHLLTIDLSDYSQGLLTGVRHYNSLNFVAEFQGKQLHIYSRNK